MRPSVAPYIESLSPYVPGKPIEETRRELGLSDVIKLASNENPLGVSPRALEAARGALAEGHLYPDASHHVLRERLGAHLGLDRNRIFVGSGSNEIIELLIRTFTIPGDRAVLCQGSFVMYKIALRSHGRELVEVPMKEGFRYDLAAMARAIDPATRIIFLANPDNPTGTAFGRDELEAFYQRVPADCLLVLDEAYFEYVDWPEYPDGQRYLDRWPNLVVLRTFSKIYGLAGFRVGYGLMAPERVAYLDRTRMPFNLSSVGQVAAIAALDDREHVRRTQELTREGRGFLERELGALGMALRLSESQANFVFVDLGRPAGPVFQALLRRGLITRPLPNYGLPNALRISVGLPAENQRLVRELKAVLFQGG